MVKLTPQMYTFLATMMGIIVQDTGNIAVRATVSTDSQPIYFFTIFTFLAIAKASAAMTGRKEEMAEVGRKVNLKSKKVKSTGMGSLSVTAECTANFAETDLYVSRSRL